MLEWLQTLDWSLVSWGLMWIMVTVGLLGTVLPFLPGPALIFLGAVIHRIGVEGSELGVSGLVLLGVLLALAYAVDFGASAAGARWFGSSRWGVTGVFVGGIVGLFFGLTGILLGPLVGGFVFEMLLAKKEVKEAGKSTWGTVIGTVAGMILKLVIAVAMVATIVVDLFFLSGAS